MPGGHDGHRVRGRGITVTPWPWATAVATCTSAGEASSDGDYLACDELGRPHKPARLRRAWYRPPVLIELHWQPRWAALMPLSVDGRLIRRRGGEICGLGVCATQPGELKS